MLRHFLVARGADVPNRADTRTPGAGSTERGSGLGRSLVTDGILSSLICRGPGTATTTVHNSSGTWTDIYVSLSDA